jgi:hypothetical protein
MKLLTFLAIAILTAAAHAQAPALVPVPFGQVFAGIAPGGSATACSASSDLPTAAGNHYGDGCLATQATLAAPYSATVDSLGNVYIGDYNNYLLRVVYNAGTALANAIVAANPTNPGLVPTPGHIYTLAGSRTGTLSQTGSPKAYYCNSAGTGTAALTSNGDACPATFAYIKPRTVALDKDGNVFFTSASGSSPIRVVYVQGTAAANLISVLDSGKVAQPGYIYSIMRSASSGYAGDGLLATATGVQAYAFRDIAIDASENIYMSDGTNAFTAPSYASNNNIRLINGTTGIVSTFAGSPNCAEPSTSGCAGTAGSLGDGGPAKSATFDSPYAIFLDASNNLYIADYNNGRLRVVYNSGSVPGLSNLTPGNVYTVAGGGTSTTSGTPATQVMFTTLFNAGMDAAGDLYAQDGTTKSLWKIDAKTGIAVILGNVAPVATAGNSCGTGTGLTSSDKVGSGCPATDEAISASGRLSFDLNGNFYETESSNAVIRKFSYNTVFPATAVGSSSTQPIAFLLPSGSTLTQGISTGDFTLAPANCATGSQVANTTCVSEVTFTPARAGARLAQLSASAGSTIIPSALSGIGLAANASVDPASLLTIGSTFKPAGVAADPIGNVYFADTTSSSLYTATASGATPVALAAGLSNPAQVAWSPAALLVADPGNNRIASLATGATSFTSLGTGLKSPQGVAVDGQGDLFIADTGNNRIVEIPYTASQTGNQITLPVTGLSAPTALALDPAGDLFIADSGNARIVELPSSNSVSGGQTGGQTVVNLGTSSIAPAGIAVDPAGNLYIADTNSQSVLEFPVGSTLSNQLVTGLKSPRGLAIDATGSLYVADSSLTGLLLANRQIPTVAFSPTNVGQSNLANLNVTSTGNAPLLFNGAALTSASGSGAANFSIAGASSNGCALATPLAPGAECALTATFAPLVKSPSLSETATLLTNAPSSSGALLTGDGVQLVSTTSNLAVTSPTSTTINYAQNVTVTATLTPASNAGAAASGNILFSVDAKSQPIQTLSGSTAAVTLTSPGVGTHVVTVSYTGDSNYASSSASLSFTVARAATSTTFTLTPSTNSGNTFLTFTAKVASPTATGATGTVSFFAGTTLLSTQPLSTSGSATYTTANLASFTSPNSTFGVSSFSAVYSGDANFAGSASASLSAAGDFTVAPTAPTTATAQGGVASATIFLTPLYNYTGTLTPSCSGLPSNSVCRFSPTTVALSGGITQTLQLLIYTNVSSTLAENRQPGSRSLIAFALLLPAALCVRRRLTPLLLALFALAAFTGCQSAGSFSTPVTPAGTSAVSITLTDATGLTHSQSIAFTVNASQ